jgi:N4 gp54-like protein|nr:MAG TPA: hypothetical protein [Caudoviricetes sp.]
MADEVKQLIISQASQDIPLDRLTHLTLDGKGIFDELLTLQRKHLQREFDEQRIDGREYAEAYKATYIATLQAAIEFLLAKEKQWYEIDLLEAQAEKARRESELLAEQIKIAKVDFLIRLKELELKEWELKIKEQELEIAKAQLALTLQKVITERAQTDGSVIGKGSVLGKQNELLDAQIKGYDNDFKLKIFQQWVSTWISRLNNDAAQTSDENMLYDKYIGAAGKKVFEAAGIPLP